MRFVEVACGLAALARGLGSDGTGVEHDHVGVFGANDDMMPGSVEAACECAIFAEVEPATQLVEEYAHVLELVAGCLLRPFVFSLWASDGDRITQKYSYQLIRDPVYSKL